MEILHLQLKQQMIEIVKNIFKKSFWHQTNKQKSVLIMCESVLIVCLFYSICVPGRCVVSLSKRHLLPKSTGNTQE